jgi:hypothetical protein
MSFVPGGIAFHGTVQVTRDEVPARSRQRVDLAACGMAGCRSASEAVTVPDPDEPRPICVIGHGIPPLQ